jgi:arginyl-tRNA--protein-N-Asp/Glu arginylyltransferase
MFAQLHFPNSLKPNELDHYLSMGWFRMGQSIFTTNFLHFKNQFYSAIWLRIELKDFSPDKAQLKLKKTNEVFRMEVRQARITQEKELLFAKYRSSVTFEASASLAQLLYGKSNNDIYNTFEIGVFDGEKLIAVGFFDIGSESAAGISSFYDPDYKRYSLGKYLILSKIEFCKNNNLKYFYPGYFVPGYASFDYKLQLSKKGLQYVKPHSMEWSAIEAFSSSSILIDEMNARLKSVQQLLNQQGITSRLFKYEFFDANLIPDLSGLELFDYPLFIAYNFSDNDELNTIIVYDVCTGHYHLVKCRSLWPSKLQNESDDVFCAHLLKIDDYLFSSPDAESIAARLQSNSQFRVK